MPVATTADQGLNGWQASALAYCGDARHGASLEAVFDHLESELAAVRSRRGVRRMAVGLTLTAATATLLEGSRRMRGRLARRLERGGLDLVTLDGFQVDTVARPAGKVTACHPDWTDPRRFDHTLRLARLLAELMPTGHAEGTIATLPLGTASGWGEQRGEAAATALALLSRTLGELESTSGRRVRLCLEPAPGGALESAAQLVDFFTRMLPAAARHDRVPLRLLRRHLAVSLDIGHQAVMFEDPAASLALLLAAGIPVAQLRLTSALEVHDPGNPVSRGELLAFIDPTRCCPVRAPGVHRSLLAAADLEEALLDPLLVTSTPWRIRCRLPLQAARVAGGRLGTTRGSVERTVAWLQAQTDCRPRIALGNAAWHVLGDRTHHATPEALATDIAAEFAWVENCLARRGLLRSP